MGLRRALPGRWLHAAAGLPRGPRPGRCRIGVSPARTGRGVRGREFLTCPPLLGRTHSGGTAPDSHRLPPLGSVVTFPSAPRRLARTLAAPGESPSTSSTRSFARHAESTHQTPRGRPSGDDGNVTTDPSAVVASADRMIRQAA
ncbi:modular polyketide synthase [Streptomyces bottropensis ATCC 25435]|uniref:Modular polyketide synthase n=1 Tax=Streptomyces bottropensis ATCC 25435 TaxID=1054862 RepID=M3FIS5_9ACTN|nr:modular polyketide synthase [Streptomyces bottropensis ATCC 25435]